MEDIFQKFIIVLKDLQGLIGVLVGAWIATRTSRKERKQKDTITESERIDRYRLSALNERLAAHQKAFEIWYNLSFSIHSDEAITKSEEARTFWIKNCLYLTPKCRTTFDKLIYLVSGYKTQWLIWRDANGDEKKKRNKELIGSFTFIMSVGQIIQEEVDITYTEPEPITKLKEEENNKLKPMTANSQ